MSHKLIFHVVQVSSQDNIHKASDLNNHTPGSKGWHSGNFCIYPQDMVLALDHRCHIKKIQLLSHQYLIATKIEFFIGDCANNLPVSLSNARFSRLGYVSLSDNEKTQFKARELKSVHVDAVGRFVKLLVHKNYINKLNHYNQVGLIAINIIGDELFNSGLDEIENVMALPLKSDIISPTEDLAFDMRIDPKTAHIIRELEKHKAEAVNEEQFDKAQKIKDKITYLTQVGEMIGKLEIEKRVAVEKQNYERAQLKKQQIEQYRYNAYRELDLIHFLDDEPPQIQEQPYKTRRSETPEIEQYTPRPLNQNNNAINNNDEQKSFVNAEERPLPALKNRQPQPDLQSPRNDIREVEEINSPEPNIPENPNEDGVVPGMTKSDLSEASDAIDVYGLPLVSKLYSKNWSNREDALLEIQKRLSDIPSETDKEDVKMEMRAATCALKKSFKSRITQVVQVAMTINKMILVELVERLAVAKPEIYHYLDKVVPEIFKCIEDNKAQIKEMTFPHMIEMSQWDHVKQFPHIFNEAIKPLHPNILARPAVIRTELLLELYSIHGLANHQFTLDNFMKYAVQALQHKSTEVRETAETLIVVLYRNEDKQLVRSYLPPDDLKTRKNILYKRLFEKLDKIDGINPGALNNNYAVVPPTKQHPETDNQTEKKSKQQPNAPTVPKVAVQSSTKNNNKAARQQQQPQTNRSENQKKPAPPPRSPETPLNINYDTMCIFCGEKNDDFKDNIDMHYWKYCPVLRRCPYCRQAVEISLQTQHLLQECEQSSQFGQCPKCTEAFLKSELDQHISDALCTKADPEHSIHCPLCQQNIPLEQFADSPESIWQYHLMDEVNGCPQNPRRLVALQRKRQQNDQYSKANTGQPSNKGGNSKKSQLPRAKVK